MHIQYAMLGLISLRPLTGYEIKKIMQQSPLFYWSGNNSQIYRTLAELQTDGLISAEVLHQDDAPTKKRYSLTARGRQELSALSRGFPQPMEIKRPILMQLAFGGDLSRAEVDEILSQYEREIRGILLADSDHAFPKTDQRFAAKVLALAHESYRAIYAQELKWIEQVRDEALPLVVAREPAQESQVNSLQYTAIHKQDQTYVLVTGGHITCEQDGLDLVGACAEHGTTLLLLPAACLSEDFLSLSTRVAGLALQKLVNYNIKTAAVLDVARTSQRFQEFVLETNKGHTFRVYGDLPSAEAWLLGGQNT